MDGPPDASHQRLEVAMPILDAALAFALTMLVVATAVTQIVRFMRNTAKLRRSELQEMLTVYFNEELKPVVMRELNRVNKKVDSDVSTKLTEAAKEFSESELFDEVELAKLIEVSTDELTERLKRSTLGQKLLTELGDEAQTIFDELGRRYEVVGDKFTESFRKYSRRWATVVALILALAVNIDSIHIAKSYIRNESLREGTVAQMDAIVAKYDAKVASLDDAGGEGTRAALEQSLIDNREQIESLTSIGFPIGWSYFPHAGWQHRPPKDFERRNDFGGWVMWFLGILLTAVLAGLGSPFWYDTVTGISRVAQRARAVKKPTA